MIELDDEITQDWMSPPDGFNDDLFESDDQKVIKAAMSNIDTLLRDLDPDRVIKIVLTYIQQSLQQNNWKFTHAAIMTISQIAEYIEEDSQIKELVDILLAQRSNPNPRVRYSICQALGQIADDQAPHFQENHSEDYFTIVLPYLATGEVPRVTAHALASMTNFLEHAEESKIQP